MQTAVEKDLKLTRILVKNLLRERKFRCSQNLINSSAKPCSTDFRQYRIHGTLTIPAEIAEQRTFRKHERSCKTCGVIELAGNR